MPGSNTFYPNINAYKYFKHQETEKGIRDNMADKQKILIVDDDNNIAELVSLYLIKECFDTQIANDGEEALAAIQNYQPDLVVLDIMLPGMSGYDVLRELRKTSNLPVIMLSAKGETFDQGSWSGIRCG